MPRICCSRCLPSISLSSRLCCLSRAPLARRAQPRPRPHDPRAPTVPSRPARRRQHQPSRRPRPNPGRHAPRKLWVIMASDFQCPFCKQWHDARFSQLMQNYVAKGRIRLGFINFPLSQHQNAMPAAEAAMCAAAQNKFLAMHEALFATQAKWETLPNPTPVFDSLATAAGVNMPAYRACVSKHLARAADRSGSRPAGRRPASNPRRRSSSAARC